MVGYRRNFVPGGTFFFTITLTDRRSSALVDHVDYIHFNPVKHGLVSRVRDWPYSSSHRDVRDGLLPDDWAGDVSGGELSCGERVEIWPA